LAPVTNELRNKLTSVREAAADAKQTAGQPRTGEELGSRAADMAKRRAALQAEGSKAEGALANTDEGRAAAVKDALGALREAASGDDAKIETASRMLEALSAPRH